MDGITCVGITGYGSVSSRTIDTTREAIPKATLGDDIFGFNAWGHVVVTDFDTAHDKLAFAVFGVSTVHQLDAMVTSVDNTAEGVTYHFGSEGSIVERDETFIGRDKEKKAKGQRKDRGYAHKFKVLSLVDRTTGKVPRGGPSRIHILC
jgi:hypothetical protein